jgi:hypothetical protein
MSGPVNPPIIGQIDRGKESLFVNGTEFEAARLSNEIVWPHRTLCHIPAPDVHVIVCIAACHQCAVMRNGDSKRLP